MRRISNLAQCHVVEEIYARQARANEDGFREAVGRIEAQRRRRSCNGGTVEGAEVVTNASNYGGFGVEKDAPYIWSRYGYIGAFLGDGGNI